MPEMGRVQEADRQAAGQQGEAVSTQTVSSDCRNNNQTNQCVRSACRRRQTRGRRVWGCLFVAYRGAGGLQDGAQLARVLALVPRKEGHRHAW